MNRSEAALRITVLDHVANWRRQAADGTLRLVFLAPGNDAHDGPRDPRASFDVGEAVGVVDELFVRHVVSLIAQVATPEVAVLIARADGQPLRCDRRLARELRMRAPATSVRLLDVLVVGTESARSALPRRAATRPLAS